MSHTKDRDEKTAQSLREVSPKLKRYRSESMKLCTKHWLTILVGRHQGISWSALADIINEVEGVEAVYHTAVVRVAKDIQIE